MASKGFGNSRAESIKTTKQLMLSFKKYLAVNNDNDNDKDFHQFFSSHLSQLDESLLKALPCVFNELTENRNPQECQEIASLFCNFGVQIAQFPLGEDVSLNVELSLSAYLLALKIFTRKVSPENWALLQNNLGFAYTNRLREERAGNIEKAIAFLDLALQVNKRDDYPENWATLQNNLGNAYLNRILGNRADNLEQAIIAYNLALQIRTRENFPIHWAETKNNLGIAYWERIKGDRADNLEYAITTYESALQIRTRENFPIHWADTQNNLANAYRDRIRGVRVDNIEEAIISFELALQVSTREAFPVGWAMLQNNLGLAYKDRIQGKRIDNLEQAITAFNLALEVSTREASPKSWAMAQHNLAKAHRDSIVGDRAKNLEQAIYIFNQAAQVFTRHSFPDRWATNQAHLAEALMKRSLLNSNCTDLDTAIELLQSALELAVVGSPDYIDTQYRLGNALSRRYEHTKNADDLEQAMQAYKIALDAISPEHYDRKQIWQALPTTQVILGSRLVSEGEWQEGLQLLLNSLTQLSTGDDPLSHANALYQTGRAYEVMADLDKARLYYRDALRLYDHLNDALGTTQSRAGLGSVLVSQGHLDKGINELAQAREGYLQLEKPEQAHETDNIYQAAQRALERQATEVYA
jgi:tetratricopeptide (TPR) repeat protein